MKRAGLLDFLIPDYFQRGKNLFLRLLHILLQIVPLPLPRSPCLFFLCVCEWKEVAESGWILILITVFTFVPKAYESRVSLNTDWGLSWWFNGKESTSQCRRCGLVSGLGRPSGGGNGNPLQYSRRGNPMDRGLWLATVHRVTKDSDMTERLNNKIQTEYMTGGLLWSVQSMPCLCLKKIPVQALKEIGLVLLVASCLSWAILQLQQSQQHQETC